MNPADFYRTKSATITDAEVRLVAAVMSDYVGEENAVRLERLSARVGMDERKVRIILERLLTEFRVPVCAVSGKPGYWLARVKSKTAHVRAELRSRIKHLTERDNAYEYCDYPPESFDELVPTQPALLDVPEPEPVPYWRW